MTEETEITGRAKGAGGVDGWKWFVVLFLVVIVGGFCCLVFFKEKTSGVIGVILTAISTEADNESEVADALGKVDTLDVLEEYLEESLEVIDKMKKLKDSLREGYLGQMESNVLIRAKALFFYREELVRLHNVGEIRLTDSFIKEDKAFLEKLTALKKSLDERHVKIINCVEELEGLKNSKYWKTSRFDSL